MPLPNQDGSLTVIRVINYLLGQIMPALLAYVHWSVTILSVHVILLEAGDALL